MPTYIVESYGLERTGPEQRERAELAASLGAGISTFERRSLPGDETLLHVFEATSSDALRQAVSVAALDCDRIVEVVEAWAEPRERDPLGGGAPVSQISE
jgi:hypothetical protein